MHEVGIVHRDLKPENILCVVPNSIKRVKIADFGISKIIKPKKRSNKLGKPAQRMPMKTVAGTLSYTAPEVLRGRGYDHRVDFWSVGIIMFILLCGYPPFYGETDQEISKAIREEDLEFDEEDWTHVSQTTRQVVEGLLAKDPKKRLTTDNLINLTFKVTSKSTSYARSRQKFKGTVAHRKMVRNSMMHTSASPSMDDNRVKFGTRQLDNPQSRGRKALQGRRGSKTTDQLELNTPAYTRESMMQDFQTDDDVRKEKKRKQEEAQNNYYKNKQADLEDSPSEEDDDYKENQ